MPGAVTAAESIDTGGGVAPACSPCVPAYALPDRSAKAPGSMYRDALPDAPAAGAFASRLATAAVWPAVMRSTMRSDDGRDESTVAGAEDEEAPRLTAGGGSGGGSGPGGGPTAMREASTVPEGTCSSTAIVTTPARRSTTVAAASILGGALSGMTSMRSPVLGPRGFDDASAMDALAAMSSRPASERVPTACTAAAFEAASRSTTSASEYPVADGRTLEPASDAGAAAPPSAARTDTPDGSTGCALPAAAAESESKAATCSSNRTVSVPAPRSSTGDEGPDSREGGLSSGLSCTVRLASAAWLPYRSSTAPAGA